MSKTNKESFGYLGEDFQDRLVAQLFIDTKFAESIIEIIDANYFDDHGLKIIVSTIKDAHAKDNIIPDYGSVEFRIIDSGINEFDKKYVSEKIQSVKSANLNDSLVVQEKAMKFCKQQELKKSIKEIQKIIDKGDYNRYDECEELLKKALEHGDLKDNGIDIFDNIENVLEDDYRKPIPTGIQGLDEVMNGGLSKSELAVILAPYGVGKEQPNSARVYTPDGYTLIGNIRVDDVIIGSDGLYQKVLGVYPQGLKDVFKIEFSDGTVAECGKEHLWYVFDKKDSQWKTITLNEIKNDYSDLRYSVPIVNQINFNNVIDDDYNLGVSVAKNNIKLTENEFHSTIHNRVKLIQGILDTVGQIDIFGGVYVFKITKEVRYNLNNLLWSMGGYLHDNMKDYTLVLIPNTFEPFTIKEKIEKYIPQKGYTLEKSIKNISYSRLEQSTCIRVSNDDHLYVTDNFVLTHNTTMITKIANTAVNLGYNVLQIFFEDTAKIIQRKHISCWTGIELNDLPLHKDEITKVLAEKEEKLSKSIKGGLKLKKFQSDGTTMAHIRQYVRKLIAKGFKPDIILLDYIDCLTPTQRFDDTYAGEGQIMRQFETLLTDYDIAGWTAVQGNRCLLLSTEIQTLRLGKTEIKNIIVGDEILTHDGYKKVSNVFPVQKQPVYKIKLKSGKEITVSKKHLFPTGNFKMKSIEMGLGIGDTLLIRK